jgi:chemotaxis protein methyltransferase CheR
VGSYSEYSVRDLDRRFLEDYFRQVAGRRVLADRIRHKVRFERLNLVGPKDYAAAGAFAMDLILCRNVLIYFAPEKIARIAARLYHCLAGGGVLLTAGADPILADHAPFEVEVTRVGLVYRRPRDVAAGSLRAGDSPASPEPRRRDPLLRLTDRGDSAAAATAAAIVPPAPPAPESSAKAFDRVMAHANAGGVEEAERMAEVALGRHPLDAHLHYLRATLLLSLDRDEEAEREAQRALYLDRSLAIAHFLFGTILRKRGADALARRAFRNARDLCAGRPSDEEVAAGRRRADGRPPIRRPRPRCSAWR